jgi:hypothetical protein
MNVFKKKRETKAKNKKHCPPKRKKTHTYIMHMQEKEKKKECYYG